MEPVASVSPILVSVFHLRDFVGRRKHSRCPEVKYFVVKRSSAVCEEGWRWGCSLYFRPWWRQYYSGGSLSECCPIFPLSLPKFLYFVETEDRLLGRSKHCSTSGMDQIRTGLPRAGECSRLWSEVREGLQQGIPDGSPGLHHEAPPLWGKTQEILQVRLEFTMQCPPPPCSPSWRYVLHPQSK